jgi:hypothetical protein
VAEVAFGLVGVIIGGLITAAANWQIERRREAREAAQRERNARTARRLIGDEIDTLAGAYAEFAGRGRMPEKPYEVQYFFPREQWERYKETLASSIEDEVLWHGLVTFYFNVLGVREIFRNLELGAPLSSDQIDFLAANSREANDVLALLRAPPSP